MDIVYYTTLNSDTSIFDSDQSKIMFSILKDKSFLNALYYTSLTDDMPIFNIQQQPEYKFMSGELDKLIDQYVSSISSFDGSNIKNINQIMFFTSLLKNKSFLGSIYYIASTMKTLTFDSTKALSISYEETVTNQIVPENIKKTLVYGRRISI
jgi:hypothetical protein